MVNKFKLASVMMKTHKTQIRIKDIGSVLTGRTPSTSNPDNYNAREICFVKPSDLCEGKINTIEDTEFYISQKAREQSVCVPINSVLVTCIGIIGKIGIATKEIAFNQQINAIIPDPDLIFYKYLAYLLLAKRRYLSELANAPVVPILNKTNFSDIQLNIHDLPEQKRIAERLDKVQELIAKQKEQIAKLDLLIKSRFLDMFGDPISNPKHFFVDSLGKICDVRDGTHESPRYVSDGYPLITSKNIVKGTISLNDVNLITKKDFDAINKRSKVDRGDILLPMIGTMGNPALVIEEPIYAIKNMALVKFTPESKCSNMYILHLLYSSFLDNIIQNQQRGGTQKFLALKTIRALQIPVPPTNLQTQFADFVKSVEQQKEVFSTRLSHLETLYKSLMQEYFG